MERLEIFIDERLFQKLDCIERQNHDTHKLLRAIYAQNGKIMADQNTILAKVTANTNILKSIQAATDVLKEGNATIADEIQKLKDAVAAGTPPDFTQLDAAVDEQSAVVAGLNAAIPANTPVAPTP